MCFRTVRRAVGLGFLMLAVLGTLNGNLSGQTAGTSVPLNTVWRVLVNPTERMSTIDRNERNNFSPDEGSIFYITQSNISGTAPLYREFNGFDHMESNIWDEANYWTESTLGYPWTTPAPFGTTQIIRGYNSATQDHATRNIYETLSGYDTEGFTLYGYRRYNFLSTSLVTLAPPGLKLFVSSNEVAGGSVWSWTWTDNNNNLIDPINTWDFGREMQSSLFPHDHSGLANWDSNPTEAGDGASNSGASPVDRSGSPLYVPIFTNGNVQKTRAIPLEFNPGHFGGGTTVPYKPVIWKDVIIGKDLTLNFNNLGKVAKYSTQIHIPNDISNADVEIPTIYVTGNYNVYWTYDAVIQKLTPLSSTDVPDACAAATKGNGSPQYSFGFGGVIVSDGTDHSNAHAIGIYGGTPQANGPGSVDYFALWNFTKATECGFAAGVSKYDFGSSKLNAVAKARNLTANSQNPLDAAFYTTFNTWVMSGSIDEITSYMNSLYAAGVK